MNTSPGLIAKGLAGLTTATAATTAGTYYRDDIYDLFFGDKTADVEIDSDSDTTHKGADNQKEEKIKTLGLPEGCNIPTSGDCSLDSKKLSKINFVGKEEGDLTVGSGANVTLEAEEDSDFPNKYKFIFKNNNEDEITINKDITNLVTLKKDVNLEFKIKEIDGKWFLERAWNAKTLAEKIGLTCPESGDQKECTGGVSLNVFESDSKKTTGVSKSGSGKIKFEENQEGYNQGIKFTIEEGDVNLTPSDGTSSISKLKEFATYEIKKQSDGTWYLSRKTSAIDVKSKLLGLPDGCKLPENDSVACEDIDANKLNVINFDGKNSSGTLTIIGGGNTSLTISKDRDVEGGYKFVFDNSKEISIPGTPDSISVKKNTNTEFKIKKDTSSNLTLKRVWNNKTIKEKIGLDCKNNKGNNVCSINTDDNAPKAINVMDGGKKRKGIGNWNSSNGKIKLYKDIEDYYQGFKFKVEGEKITLTDGTQEGDVGDVTELEVGSEYEIKLEENTWYLSKKTA